MKAVSTFRSVWNLGTTENHVFQSCRRMNLHWGALFAWNSSQGHVMSCCCSFPVCDHFCWFSTSRFLPVLWLCQRDWDGGILTSTHGQSFAKARVVALLVSANAKVIQNQSKLLLKLHFQQIQWNSLNSIFVEFQVPGLKLTHSLAVQMLH